MAYAIPNTILTVLKHTLMPLSQKLCQQSRKPWWPFRCKDSGWPIHSKSEDSGIYYPANKLNFPQISSKMPQNGPKMDLEWPQMIQSGPKMTQNGPKMTPGFTHFFQELCEPISLSLSSALWAQRLAHKTLARLGEPLQRSNTLCYSDPEQNTYIR